MPRFSTMFASLSLLFAALCAAPAAHADWSTVTWPAGGVFHTPLVVMYTTNAGCPYQCSDPSQGDMSAYTKVDLYVFLPGDDGVTLQDPKGPKGAFNVHGAVKLTAEMHVRGQSTLHASKHQFAVKLTQDWPAAQANGNFMGMPHGGKHWVFNAPGIEDQTFIRNVMAFDMQRVLGENTKSEAWAPRSRYFEFFAIYNQDGNSPLTVQNAIEGYQGAYINLEHIRPESHRIDIPDPYAPAAGTKLGGVIIQVNPEDATQRQELVGASQVGNTSPVFLQWPELSFFNGGSGTSDQLDDIQDWFHDSQAVDSFPGWAGLFMPDCIAEPPDYTVQPDQCPGCTDEASYWANVDTYTKVSSFAEYFLLNELAKDPDGYHKSTFMYREPDSLDKNNNPVVGQIYAGPLWDKNKSYSLGVYGGTFDSPKGWLFNAQSCTQAPYWWLVLSRYPTFQQELATVWGKSRDDKTGAFGYTRIAGVVQEQVNYLLGGAPGKRSTPPSGPYTRDQQCWHATDPATAANQLQDEVDDMLSYINKRLTWMDDNMSKVGTAVTDDCQ